MNATMKGVVVQLHDPERARNRKLQFAIGRTVSGPKGNRVKNCEFTWAEFVEKLRSPLITPETISEYLKAPKAEQDRVKDIGYYVPGHFANGIRKKGNLATRDCVPLDIDHITPSDVGKISDIYGKYEYVLHSTHKHTGAKPRLRLLFPMSRSVTADEYPAVARALANLWDLDAYDDTTYEFSRVMHFPSMSCDAEYVFRHNTGAFLDPVDMLNTYLDPTDASEWPISSRQREPLRAGGRKAQDPNEKQGVIGAFCGAYSVLDAIDAFLPGKYEAGGSDRRLTFVGGSTTNGVCVYDNDKFLYSHHESDPCAGQLVNSFDLVRLHLWGDLDTASSGKPVTERESYKKMIALARSDQQVKVILAEQRLGDFDDFESEDATDDQPAVEDDGLGDGLEAEANSASAAEANSEPQPIGRAEWQAIRKAILAKCRLGDGGAIIPNLYNLDVIFDLDPRLKGTIALNEFRAEPMQMRPIPGMRAKIKTEGNEWTDSAEIHVKAYLERVYKVTYRTNLIHEGSDLIADKNRFHPITEYLNSLVWDGEPRAESLFVRYFGADDSPYVRAVTIKFLCATVARVYVPGIKYDSAIVLESKEGLGKSTLAKVLARGYFTDDLHLGLDSKQLVEKTRGVWIGELAEMVHNNSEVEAVKAFLSRNEERVRLSYGRNAGVFPRQFTLIGTTNESTYLRSVTGNRRIHPIKGDGREIDIDAIRDNLDQIWAEAVHRWKVGGEKLYLDTTELVAAATVEQNQRVETDDWGPMIEGWLDGKSADDFHKRGTKRNQTTAAQIFTDAIGGSLDRMTQRDSRRVTNIMNRMPGWEKRTKIRLGGIYGPSRGFARKGYVSNLE
jgi:putative DNA primase/helicase